jgi:hypothetical protein
MLMAKGKRMPFKLLLSCTLSKSETVRHIRVSTAMLLDSLDFSLGCMLRTLIASRRGLQKRTLTHVLSS